MPCYGQASAWFAYPLRHHSEIEIIAERTLAFSSTHATSDTTLNGLLANADDFSLYALFVQGLCHLIQSRKRIAMFFGASVNQKYLCHISKPTIVISVCVRALTAYPLRTAHSSHIPRR